MENCCKNNNLYAAFQAWIIFIGLIESCDSPFTMDAIKMSIYNTIIFEYGTFIDVITLKCKVNRLLPYQFI